MIQRRTALPAALLAAAGALALCAVVGCGGGAFSAAPSDGDSGVSADAATDASSGGPFCEHTDVTFCEDFDEVSTVSDLTAKWNGLTIGNGVLSLVPGLRSPHALAATAGNGDRASILHAPFEKQPQTSIRLEYDLRVDAQAVQTFDRAELTSVVLGSDPTNDATVYLYLGGSGALVLGWTDPADAGNGFHWDTINHAPAPGMWDGRWGIQIGVADGSLSVTHDTVTVLTSSQKLSAAALHPSAVTVNAGLTHDTGSTGTVTVAIDNLVLDIK